ncbi:MAG TPA: TetR-like C-terminal domain-containing protein [Rubrobacter sp.]|nr:TetR-like C-terminal domain-containing protein [Rubrobacter sp.]
MEAAAALADEEGAGGELSLARLAERLGVRKPSLYNHVGGVGDLRRELALVGLRELGWSLSRAVAGKAGEEGLFALAEDYRRFVKQRPGLYEATIRSYRLYAPNDPELGAAEAEALEPVLAVLDSRSIGGEEAIHAARGLRSIAHGFATLEEGGGFGIDVDADDSFRRLVRSFVDGLDGGPSSGMPGS